MRTAQKGGHEQRVRNFLTDRNLNPYNNNNNNRLRDYINDYVSIAVNHSFRFISGSTIKTERNI